MTDAAPIADPRRALRRSVYALLIAASVAGMAGRILAVNSVDTVRLEKYLKDQGRKDWQKQRPFLSSNDRSRWATVRALVEHGTYQIDEIVSQPNWDTIDMVKHDDEGRPAPKAGQGHLYSSKPPLLATLLAGPYWLIYQWTGATLGEHPFAIGRGLLLVFNGLPMIVYFLAVSRLVERFGGSDWGRMFVMTCAAFGTFLSTFAVTINNHLTAAVAAAIALDASLRIWYDDERRLRWFLVAGLFAAFTAANELPALAFAVAVTVGLLYKAPAGTLKAFLPGALIVAAAAEGTNYLAHRSWIPAYAHRKPGDNWYDYQFLRNGKVRDSYWSKPEARSPIDQGEPEPGVYVFHALVGHHGIFSLTPVWLFSFLGMAMLCLRRSPDWRALGLLLGSVSLVCLAFYLQMPQEDRNYGGMTSGFRWVFWFAPLWLVAMLPAADLLAAHRWSRGLAIVFLGLSVLSASYPTWNPWVHPWLLDFLESQHWVGLGMR
ncbi:MAG: hypothetical protein B7Z73_02865 [Planctomycetia bacterium 21-64-5]|nr:MAG: hypothetical protein B7Z73_02865 [Planctomycetia bacterium 21-64-5]HQU43315.1 hypothetical protein [Pirellulales bacterium]